MSQGTAITPELQTWLLDQDNLLWETILCRDGRRQVEVRMCEEGDLLGVGGTVLDALAAAMDRCEGHRHPGGG